MINVKITSGDPDYNALLTRHLPLGKRVWGECVFHINSDVIDCDWWFILHSSSLRARQVSVCDPTHVVFVSMEPLEFNPPSFYDQFSTLVACDPYIKHPSLLRQNPITWWAGIDVEFKNGHLFQPHYNYSYDDFASMGIPDKHDRISIVTSTNRAFPGHESRLRFIESLMLSPLADRIDLFGGGHRPIHDKIDAMLPYKYHVCLENSVLRNYWTEKIADSYLGFALPIYYGCPNIADYFPRNSFLAIDIRDHAKAIRLISKAIANDMYLQRRSDLMVARARVLDDYNIFNLLSRIASTKARSKSQCIIEPPSSFPPYSPSRLERLRRKIVRFPQSLAGQL